MRRPTTSCAPFPQGPTRRRSAAQLLAVGVIAVGLSGCASFEPIVEALLRAPDGPLVAETSPDRRAPMLLSRGPDAERLATIEPAAGGSGYVSREQPIEQSGPHWAPEPDDMRLRHIELAPVMFSIFFAP
jgi:hypothetical protein